MKLYEEIERNPSARDRLELGATILGGTLLFGALYRFVLAKPDIAMGLWIAGPVAFVLALVPGVGRWLYILWMGLGVTLGAITSPFIMLVIYVVLVVPTGLVMKLRGRDTMKRRLEPEAATYWEDYPRAEDPRRYVRQF